MSVRNKVMIFLGLIFVAALIYYLVSTPSSKDLVLIGTVDSNQVIVSPQVAGRIAKLLVDEGTPVKQGDLIALIDPAELEAQAHASAAMIDSLRSQVNATQATKEATQGSTTSGVANAQARLASARSQLAQAEANLVRVQSDSQRTIDLANAGVASEQEKVQADSNLKAQQATVQALRDQVNAANADLNTAIANTHQAHAAESTVRSVQGQLANAEAQLKEAEVRLGYTKVYAPVTGTVSVRAAREGEVLNAGQPIVTVVDLSDTWVRAAIPETNADHIGLGDSLRVRLPGGTITSGKVFFKSAEADFATQRDVSRRKRDIKTIVLKIRLANPKGAYVPGMTADILVSQDTLEGKTDKTSATAGQQ